MTLYLLGTGAAVSEPHRTTTMLALESEGEILLVDCGGDVIQRCLYADLDPHAICGLLLTHEHPDHVSGYPLLLEKLWLLERRAPLPVYGPEEALYVAETLFAAFDTSGWEGLPERLHHPIPPESHAPVMESGAFCVTSTPVMHPPPTVGVRVEAPDGSVIAYSADTAATESVVELARGADILVHEATGSMTGVHSSAAEAAAVAKRAGVGRLLLVHLPAEIDHEDLEAARVTFSGTELGAEGGRYFVEPRAASL